jgi:WD40 repeat protein
MSKPLRSRRLRWRTSVILGLAVLAIIGFTGLSGERSARIRLVLWDSKGSQPCRFSQDGQTLIGCDPDRIIFHIWDTFTGVELKTFSPSTVRYAVIIPDGRLLGFDGDDTLKVLDPATGRQQATPLTCKFLLPCPHDLVFSPTGDLAAVREDEEVVVWDTVTWKKQATIASPHEVRSPAHFAFSADGRTLGVSYYDYATVIWWDLSTGKQKAQFDKGADRVFYPEAFSPDLETVVADQGSRCAPCCGPYGKEVMLWHLRSGERTIIAPSVRLGRDFRSIEGQPFSPDGQTIALRQTSFDEPLFRPPIVARLLGLRVHDIETFRVTLYDVPSGRPRVVLPDCRDGIFSPDGTTFAGATGDGIALWEIPER